MTVANFIIAGTEKAGTTSVFSYLSQHPEVAASRRKETNFFRSDAFHTGPAAAAGYAEHFPAAHGRPVVMEASPAYLGEAEQVVPRMRAMIPDVKLLFILREPVARFLSSYHFHRAKLNLPPQLEFRDYLDACVEYAGTGAAQRGGVSRARGIDEWFLKVLPFGCYAAYLCRYFEVFPREQIRVAFYDDLCADPRQFMERLGEFLHIDRSYWMTADFKPVNVTFSGRSRSLHRLAVLANDRLESLLRPRPRLKSAVVAMYKRLNGAQEGYEAMSDLDRQRLECFYAPHNRNLESLIQAHLPAGWCTQSEPSTVPWQAQGRRVVSQ